MPSTISIAQRPGGTTIQFDRGKWSGSASYVIRDTTGAALTASTILADAAVVSKLFPVEYGGSGGAITDQGGYFSGRVTSPVFDLKMIDDGGYVWEATVSFASQTADNGTTTQDNKVEREVGFTSIEYSLGGEPVDVYRVKPTAPANMSDPADTDIGGTRVDNGGEPISIFNNVARVTVRNVKAGRPTPPLSYINTRNSASFSIGPYSFAAHTLLFTGCNISRVGPATYEITYSFVYDSLCHLRQIAKRNAENGEVVKGAKTSVCGVTLIAPADGEPSHAVCVYYRQPFKDTTAFSGIGMTGI